MTDFIRDQGILGILRDFPQIIENRGASNFPTLGITYLHLNEFTRKKQSTMNYGYKIVYST